MRDPKRIKIKFLLLKELWGNNADLRFNQFVTLPVLVAL